MIGAEEERYAGGLTKAEWHALYREDIERFWDEWIERLHSGEEVDQAGGLMRTHRWIAWSTYRGGMWVRVCGWGLSLVGTPPVFSERYGHRRPILRCGRWRLFWLKRAA